MLTIEEIKEEIAALLMRLDELEAELYLTQYPDLDQTNF